jgi:hypothetical protein
MLRSWRRISLVEIFKKFCFIFSFGLFCPAPVTEWVVRVSCVHARASCTSRNRWTVSLLRHWSVQVTTSYTALLSSTRCSFVFFSSLGYIRFVFFFSFIFRGICVFVPPPSLLRNYISFLFKKIKEKERKKERESREFQVRSRLIRLPLTPGCRAARLIGDSMTSITIFFFFFFTFVLFSLSLFSH